MTLTTHYLQLRCRGFAKEGRDDGRIELKWKEEGHYNPCSFWPGSSLFVPKASVCNPFLFSINIKFHFQKKKKRGRTL